MSEGRSLLKDTDSRPLTEVVVEQRAANINTIRKLRKRNELLRKLIGKNKKQ